MKIAIVSQGDKASGAEVVTAELYDKIKSDITLLSGSKPILSFFKDRGFPTVEVHGLMPMNRSSLRFGTLFQIIHSWGRLRKQIAELKPEYIHVYNLASLLYTAIAMIGRLNQYHVILHVHDYYSKSHLLAFISKLLRNKPNYIVAVSESVKQDLIKVGFSATRIRCIHNGIDTGLPPRNTLEQNTSFTIGFVGSLSRWKGLHILLKAARILEEQGLVFKFVIVGAFADKTYEREIRNLCHSVNKSKIIFLGKRNDARNLIRKFDVLVHCSIEADPFPTVLLEGMHLGCPVIGSDCGGVLEIIDDDSTGLLFHKNSPKSLAQTIEKIYYNRDLRIKMAVKALKKAKNEYSLSRFRRDFFNYVGLLK
ncbi:glycosyltransferase family 4 protein [Sporolactobacillus vineae]|uniref:glycosyltransferase family 4 protein n=1 Tax=Sporolactobacillus vineae TaxID=444463 RepID=UPI000287E9AE|nr:glycosyltransferase family 4 protein [Sporolactobacillus vineae]